jgi:subtilisin family serine protease
VRRPNFALVLVVVSLAFAGLHAEQKQAKPPVSVPGEILVRFSPAADRTRIQGFFGANATRVIKYYSAVDVYHLRVPAGQSTDKAVDQYRAMPEVLAAQPNYIRRAIALPNDPFFTSGQQWAPAKIKATDVWTGFTTGDSSVVIADIDTGVEYTHPDLASNMWRNPAEIADNGVDDDGNGYVDDVFGIDVIDANEAPGGPENPMDDHGHGTHVAGTIAGVGNNGAGVAGITWNSKILACKFLDSAGEGSDAGAIGCFDYILTLKRRGVNIRVSNNSWNGYTDGPSPVLQWAIDQAGSAGILNVFAAGNDGTNLDTAKIYCPASIPSPSIIAVAASDRDDNRPTFSNFGATRVDLAAPGVDIASTFLNGGYAESSGTSMAAAHVAGGAALLLALDSTLTVESLKTLILNNVDVLPQWQGAVLSGGRLNLLKAAQELAPPPPPPGGTTGAFIGTDTTTQGNWFVSHGVDGYAIHPDMFNIPSFAQFAVTGANNITWAASTTEIRALQRPDGSGRLASAWFGNTIGFAINLTDGQLHDVAFYALDWDDLGRAERFDVINATTGQLLATHSISGFRDGVYVIFRISGNVLVRVTSTSTVPNTPAVVSGIFFGGPVN